MVQVPVTTRNTVDPQGETTNRFQYAETRNLVGPAMDGFGDTVSQAADVLHEADIQHDNAAAKEAANAVTAHYAEIGYTGPNAYYSKQGRDALELRPTVEKSLDSIIEQQRQGLSTKRQRDMFDEAMIPQRTQWGVQIATHADKETKTYDSDQSTSRLGLSGQLATFSYLQDPQHGEEQIGTGLSEIENLGRLNGWSPERAAVEKLKFTSGVYKDVGDQIAKADPANGPDLARAFIDKHRGSMTGDDAQAVTDRALVVQNGYEADQRRIASEQRRMEREAASDHRDRAETALGRLGDGTPLSNDEFSTALEDARASGDDGLVKRVQDAQFKNGLVLQYAGVPPPKLQSRVNELSAKIAKAGTKADHADILERDTLQTVLAKSNSEIGNDSLSWAATHLGIDPGKLNFADSGTIGHRIQAANTVAKRTGRPPQPFTNEEAAQQATRLKGDAGEKLKLALDISKFGPMALDAAQQVAPNDHGFQNLVGLATHENSAVATFRVHQVITGEEVLKTKPKLIDNNQSFQQFNDFVGTSLQFFPSTAAGVYENAKAILASDANEKGVSEWQDASKRWYASVNMALGAYTKDGKQYGGLTKFNGTTTVLPENMDQATFEQRISRAQGPQIQKAAGMKTPVFANGQHPTASDIKKMQWVPVGDGLYALSDGHSFVGTNDGGKYTIDIRKLP